ncbi:MAG TPA: 50S ribosomal protein L27 [Patescibacteria group bacterium]|nr:50S ribosomal protein L27 [Patescibacteria group bacterium]
MSHHKAAGKTRQHTSPAGKRLGVKVSHGQKVKAGSVLVRQHGSKVHAGSGTKYGRDFTVFSIFEGTVNFGTKLGKKFISING